MILSLMGALAKQKTSAEILTMMKTDPGAIQQTLSSPGNIVEFQNVKVLIDFSLTVKAATLIFIYGRGSAISSAKQGKSGSIYNLVKN